MQHSSPESCAPKSLCSPLAASPNSRPFQDAFLPEVQVVIALVFLLVLPEALEVLYTVTRRYGKAVVRGTVTVATTLNDEAATVVRLTAFFAVVLALIEDVPFGKGFHALYVVVALFLLSYRCVQGIVLALQAIGKIASKAWISPAIGWPSPGLP